MAVRTIAYLKDRFSPGRKPTGQDFADLIDTLKNDGGGGTDPGDGEPPTLQSMAIYTANKSLIIVEFDKDLNPTFLGSLASYSLSLGRTVTAQSISGRFLYLTASAPYAQGDTVTCGYNAATAGGDALRDTEEPANHVATFSPQNVTNNISNAAGTFPTEAILILGYDQSNGVGRGNPSPGNEVTASLDCWEYRLSTDDISHLEDPTGEGDATATSRSMYVAMANKINQLTGKPVIVVKAGKGNTNIAQFNDPTNTVIYTPAKDRWDGLVNFCATNSTNPITIIGAYMHFLQGENDAGSLEVDGYLIEQNILVDNVKTDFVPITHVFLTRIGYDPGYTSAANSEKIMKAKNYAVLQRDEIVMGSIAPATYTTGNGKMQGDNVHYSVTGLNQAGNEVGESIHHLRQNNAKKFWAENVTALQDPVGYFDDIYVFRSFLAGTNRTNYNELYGRNNLTKSGSGTTTWDGLNGLIVGGSAAFAPTTVRTLTNAHDWSVELTFSMSSGDGMFINGNRGAWNEDWLWIDSAASIHLKANGVVKSVSLSGANFANTSNLAIVHTVADGTVRVYVDKALKATFTDWAFADWKLESFLRGYQTTPGIIWNGTVARIRIVKRALAAYEFDTTLVSSTPTVIDLHFDFDNSIDEVNNMLTTQAILYSTGAPISPMYAGDRIDLDLSWYILLSQTINLPDDFTIEWEGTRANDTTVAFLTGPFTTPLSGGFGNKIGFDSGNVSAAGNYIDPLTATTSSHVYKLEQDKAGNTLKLYVDTVLVGTVAALTSTLEIRMLFSGHPTQAYSYEGTVRYLKIKNFI